MYYTECANPTLSRARLSLSANAVVIIKGLPPEVVPLFKNTPETKQRIDD